MKVKCTASNRRACSEDFRVSGSLILVAAHRPEGHRDGIPHVTIARVNRAPQIIHSVVECATAGSTTMPLDLAARLGGAGGRNSVLFVPHNTGEEREIYQPAARTNRLSFQWVNISRLLLGRRRSSCSAAAVSNPHRSRVHGRADGPTRPTINTGRLRKDAAKWRATRVGSRHGARREKWKCLWADAASCAAGT